MQVKVEISSFRDTAFFTTFVILSILHFWALRPYPKLVFQISSFTNSSAAKCFSFQQIAWTVDCAHLDLNGKVDHMMRILDGLTDLLFIRFN
jgi:hypothetical protein